MNGIRVLCDTNVLIHLLNGNSEVADFLEGKQVFISAITELELYRKPDLNKKDLEVIDSLVESCHILELTQPVKQLVKNQIIKNKIKLPDSIIASTAIYSDIPLVTFDSDFTEFKELKLILLKL